MGILRIYLAICVIAAHSDSIMPWDGHGGREAVQVFFIISGFYMQLVLSSSKYGSTLDFYRSRLLRIFTPYYLILALVVMLSVASGVWFDDWLTLSSTRQAFVGERPAGSGAMLALLSNGTLFFQDWVMFGQQAPDGSLEFAKSFYESPLPLWQFLWLPPAWSVGVELTFYLVAPFLVRKLSLRVIGAIAGASLLFRLIGYSQWGLGCDPWKYRFFPFELAFFCYGIIGCRLMQRFQGTFDRITRQNVRIENKLGGWYYPVLVASFVASAGIHAFLLDLGRNQSKLLVSGGHELFYLATLPIWIVGVPVLFSITRNNRMDRAVGELSYPVYLLHYTILLIVSAMVARLEWSMGWVGELTTVFTILTALVLQRFVLERIESRRQAMIQRRLPAQNSQMA